MLIQSDFSLKNYNTFGINAKAKHFAEFQNLEDLIFLLEKFNNIPQLILGGGSNILFTQDFEGIVLLNDLQGVEKIDENESHVWLKAGAGVNWHDFVRFCLENNWAGVENLSLIPGTVGAAPMQNIGAYGIEIKDVIENVIALEIKTGKLHVFSNEDCKFGYRESIFKHEAKNKFIIAAVTFRLSKNPQFNITYGAIADTLKALQIQELSIKAISQAVCHIRLSKLPNPAEIGNAGSFFKNPEISKAHFEKLKAKFSEIVSYPASENLVKIPAGWLIEQAGWKGNRFGEVGVHAKQALVLVNYGNGTGKEILALAQQIQVSVLEKFEIQLVMEVNII